MPRISQTDRDRLSPVWDMSQERQFIETIMNQRFNFFLVFFAVVLAGAVNAKTRLQLVLVLLIGTVVSFLLTYTILRAHRKLGTVLDVLWVDETHPSTIIDRAHHKALSVRWVLGILIPWGCTAALAAGTWAAYTGTLTPPRQVQESELLSVATVALTKELEAVRERQADQLKRIEAEVSAMRDLCKVQTEQRERPNKALQRTRPAQASEPRR